MTWFTGYCVLATVAAGLSAVLVLGLRAWRSPARVILAVLPLALVGLGARAAQSVLSAPNQDWAGARLSPLIGMRFGYAMYYGASDGPVLNTIYSPLSYLIYLPAGLFSQPALEIAAASFIGLVCFFAPVLILFFSLGGKESASRIYAGASFILFALIAFNMPSLRMSLEGTIHDCPALGLGLAACLPLCFRHQNPWFAWLASATFAVLSVWAKQVMVPLLIALPLWLLLKEGKRAALPYLLCMGAAGAIISLIFISMLGPSALLFNIWTLPAHHPWNGSFPGNVLGVGYYFYRECFVIAGVLVGLIVLMRSEAEIKPIGLDGYALFVLVALCNIPTALLGRLKVGGSANNFSVSTYFLLIGLLVCLHQACISTTAPTRRLAQTAVAIAVVGLALVFVPQQAYFFRDFAGLRDTKEAQVTRFVRNHPGAAYFPWNPLPHLAAEGRLYHFAYGLFDRELGGFRIDAAHFRKFVPAHCRYVCFPGGRRDHRRPACLEALLVRSRLVQLPELQGFECYEIDE
jgi:hypothetical protein